MQNNKEMGLIYDYAKSYKNNELNKLEQLFNNDALIELVNTNETYDVGSYIEFLNLRMLDSTIIIERCSDYIKDNSLHAFTIFTYKGETNYKVVSFYNIDKENNKINGIEEYWFNIF